MNVYIVLGIVFWVLMMWLLMIPHNIWLIAIGAPIVSLILFILCRIGYKIDVKRYRDAWNEIAVVYPDEVKYEWQKDTYRKIFLPLAGVTARFVEQTNHARLHGPYYGSIFSMDMGVDDPARLCQWCVWSVVFKYRQYEDECREAVIHLKNENDDTVSELSVRRYREYDKDMHPRGHFVRWFWQSRCLITITIRPETKIEEVPVCDLKYLITTAGYHDLRKTLSEPALLQAIADKLMVYIPDFVLDRAEEMGLSETKKHSILDESDTLPFDHDYYISVKEETEVCRYFYPKIKIMRAIDGTYGKHELFFEVGAFYLPYGSSIGIYGNNVSEGDQQTMLLRVDFQAKDGEASSGFMITETPVQKFLKKKLEVTLHVLNTYACSGVEHAYRACAYLSTRISGLGYRHKVRVAGTYVVMDIYYRSVQTMTSEERRAIHQLLKDVYIEVSNLT